jgi:hypothetical protein
MGCSTARGRTQLQIAFTKGSRMSAKAEAAVYGPVPANSAVAQEYRSAALASGRSLDVLLEPAKLSMPGSGLPQ